MMNSESTFLRLESLLSSKFTKAHAEAMSLAKTVLDAKTATPELCWERLWNKPLYANTKVAIADTWVGRLSPYMSGAWQVIGVDQNFYLVSKTKPGIQRDAFEIQGNVAVSSGIAAHRLFAIQGSADALRIRARLNPFPFSDLYEKPLHVLVPALRKEFGFGWGNITAMHFLTDMGRTVKPDLHLVRAVKSLSGMFSEMGDHPATLGDTVRISDWVHDLTECFYGDSSPQHLRYVDKMLMEFSRQEILGS